MGGELLLKSGRAGLGGSVGAHGCRWGDGGLSRTLVRLCSQCGLRRAGQAGTHHQAGRKL